MLLILDTVIPRIFVERLWNNWNSISSYEKFVQSYKWLKFKKPFLRHKNPGNKDAVVIASKKFFDYRIKDIWWKAMNLEIEVKFNLENFFRFFMLFTTNLQLIMIIFFKG